MQISKCGFTWRDYVTKPLIRNASAERTRTVSGQNPI